MLPTRFTTAGLLRMLADLLGGELAAATVSLFVNDVNPLEGAVIGDFTLATFTGSTPIALGTFGEVYASADGGAESVAPLMQWDWDAGDAETVYGIVIKSAAVGTPLLGYARLENAREMNNTADSLVIIPRFKLSLTDLGTFLEIAA